VHDHHSCAGGETDAGFAPQAEREREPGPPVPRRLAAVEPLAQQRQAALQLALDRRRRQAEADGDRGRTEVVEVAQQQRVLVRRRQPHQRHVQPFDRLAPCGDVERRVDR